MQNHKAYIAAGLVLFGPMGACATTSPKPAMSSNMEPALPALSYSWKPDYAVALEPPVAVQRKAHAACVQCQFDFTFMTSLSFENDQATAVFICRGADLLPVFYLFPPYDHAVFAL
jgi:hypothetical protein